MMSLFCLVLIWLQNGESSKFAVIWIDFLEFKHICSWDLFDQKNVISRSTVNAAMKQKSVQQFILSHVQQSINKNKQICIAQ